MTARVVFVGDEVAAAGFRLAGIRTRTPAAGEEAAALREESAHAALILIAQRTAARVAAAELRRALASVSPLVLVVPDAAEKEDSMDISAQVRLQLGVGES